MRLLISFIFSLFGKILSKNNHEAAINNNINKIENAIYKIIELVNDYSNEGIFNIFLHIYPFSKDKNYYFIENQKTKEKIGINKNSITFEKNKLENTEKFLWKIIPHINRENNIVYYVQNCYSKKYLIKTNYNKKIMVKCSFSNSTGNSLNENNEFRFIKFYRQVERINDTSDLLLKEPIDVVYTYSDVNDPDLFRKDVETLIKKNIQNGELKYSLRSVLKNIPWIRKIFIVMPNKKVKFLKDENEIKDKIIYVNDKNLTGLDTNSVHVIHLNLFNLNDS